MDEVIIANTRIWLEKAVIGLNFCPFAKSVYVKQQVHFSISRAVDEVALFAELHNELYDLQKADPNVRETTLLIIPNLLADFLDFNDLVCHTDALLHDMGLAGELQIASFHPQFQFSGTTADDISNCTNRAPYPILHLLREESIDRAVASFPDASKIYERNIEVLNNLGAEGWEKLWVSPS